MVESTIAAAVVIPVAIIFLVVLMYVQINRCQRKQMQHADLVKYKGHGKVILPGLKFRCPNSNEKFSEILKELSYLRHSKDEEANNPNETDHKWLELTHISNSNKDAKSSDLEGRKTNSTQDIIIIKCDDDRSSTQSIISKSPQNEQKLEQNIGETSCEFNDEINEEAQVQTKTILSKHQNFKDSQDVQLYHQESGDIEMNPKHNFSHKPANQDVLNLSQWNEMDISIVGKALGYDSAIAKPKTQVANTYLGLHINLGSKKGHYNTSNKNSHLDSKHIQQSVNQTDTAYIQGRETDFNSIKPVGRAQTMNQNHPGSSIQNKEEQQLVDIDMLDLESHRGLIDISVTRNYYVN
eukprot:403371143